jgi:hypothetical protein
MVSIEISKHQLFAHRGLWKETGLEANSREAIVKSVRNGFSLETDIRDSDRKIVVSHDPTYCTSTLLTLDILLDELQASGNSQQMMALNVKADGLSLIEGKVLDRVKDLQNQLYFFDMSIPETMRYSRASMPFAIRASEYESITDIGHTVWPSKPSAVWVDGFHDDWFLEHNGTSILRLADIFLLTIVSPELHGRDSARFEAWFKKYAPENKNLSVCTDYPERFLL